jgi:hypothetical protein
MSPHWAKALLRSFIQSPEEWAPKPFYVLKTKTDDGIGCYITIESSFCSSRVKAVFFLTEHAAIKAMEALHRKGRSHGIAAYDRVYVVTILPAQYN